MRRKLLALFVVFMAVAVFTAAFVSTASAGLIVCCMKPYDPVMQCSACLGWKYVQESSLDCHCVPNDWCPWSYSFCW